MSPVRVVHCGEGQVFLVALYCRQHHVSRINRMHEVRRERRLVLGFVYWLSIQVLCYCDLLKHSLNEKLCAHVFVWLAAW